MKITEQLAPYNIDFSLVLDEFLYELNSARIRDVIIQKMYEILHDEPIVCDFEISDVSDDDTIDSGRLSIQITNPENNEYTILSF